MPFIGSITAVITGHMSLSQIKQRGEGGRGLGLTGTILGWVGIGLILLSIIVLLAFVPFFVANVRTYSSWPTDGFGARSARHADVAACRANAPRTLGRGRMRGEAADRRPNPRAA